MGATRPECMAEPFMTTLSIRRCGSPSRPTVGIVQTPTADHHTAAKALLVRPIGMEATRSASMLRVLSERLARSGVEVLRFDYHGTGDSPGEESEQSLSGWVQDIVDAHNSLQDTSAACPTHWFAMGLGANMALQAALRSSPAPRHLILWEPVVAGSHYIDSLLQAHKAEMAMQLGWPWPILCQRGMVKEPSLPGSVLGFDMGPQLLNDLRQLAPLKAWLPEVLQRGIAVSVMAPEDQLGSLAPLGATNTGASLKLHRLQARTNWMSSQATGTAVVPPELLALLPTWMS